MVNKVVLSYPTHGQRRSSLQDGNHQNDDLTYFSISKNVVWTQYCRATPYRIQYLALKPSIAAGESTKYLNLPI